MKKIIGVFASLVVGQLGLASSAFALSPAPQGETFSVMRGGRVVGSLVATETEGATKILYDYKDNGRGPTMSEVVRVNAAGLPIEWKVEGATTFGSKVNESFRLNGTQASWEDATGPGSARVEKPTLYISQSASPWAYGLYARALSNAGGKLPALPGGEVKLEEQGKLTLTTASGTVDTTVYTLSGIDTERQTIFLDGNKRLVAYATPEFLVARAGLEGEDRRLRAQVAEWDTKRLQDLVREVSRKPAGDLRIRNVRIFDPVTLKLSEPSSVLVKGNRIAAIEKADAGGKGETLIDGKGGTLVAGFHEMHGHLGQSSALENLVAGITAVRDMGNDDPVLDRLVERIESGELAGPRVIRSAFIEGKSATNAQTGTVVDNKADAIKAVQDAARRGVIQIKIYTSINPEWVPDMVAEAHRLGLRVAGHVPAFTTTDAMIEAGYDEITHSNQLMLNWVLKPGEDTRTLLRITALKRFGDFDVKNSPAAQKTLRLMAEKKVAHDPTLIIIETIGRGRKGQFAPGVAAWGPHMPIGVQRSLKQPMLEITPEDDKLYWASLDTTMDAMRQLHQSGVMILPGTDMGGSFWYHRELELFTNFMSNAEVLKRATKDAADYMGLGKDYGAIKPGMVADFMLLPADPVADIKAVRNVAMVVKDGTVYFPAQVYEATGIKPFAQPPAVSGAGFKPAG